MEKGKPNLKKILVIAGAAVVAAIALVAVFVGSQKLTATTMRLLKKEGEVKLFDKDKEKTIIDNLRLASGNALTTAAESIASIALDDTKIVTLNNNSRADFEQNGKKLKINLTEGSLFFQVKEKLEADASFDIKTANLVVGIRGTSGLVEANPDGTHSVTITDGEVEVSIVNKETGQSKTIRVKAGEKAKIILHDGSVEDSIEVIMDELHEADLGTVITDRLVEDEDLMIKVCDATGWNEETIRMVNENPDAMVATSDGSDDNPDGTDPDGTPGGEGAAPDGEAGEAAGDGTEVAEAEPLAEEPLAVEDAENTEGNGEGTAEVAEGTEPEDKEKADAKDGEDKKEAVDADKKDPSKETEDEKLKAAEAEKQKAAEAEKKAAEAAKKKEAEAAKKAAAEEAAKKAAAEEAAKQQAAAAEAARQQAAAAEAAKQAEAQKQAEWEKFQAAMKAAEEEAKEKERQEQAAAAAAAAAAQQQSSGNQSSSSGNESQPDDGWNPDRDEPWNDPNYNPDSDPWSDPNYNPDSDPYSDPDYNPDSDPYSDPNYNPDGNDPNYNPDGTEGGNP